MKSRSTKGCLWSILLLLPMFAIGCGAVKPKEIQSKTFHPIMDSMVQSINADKSFGETRFLYVGKNGYGTKRTYLLFDVSSIPFNSKVVAANLHLYYDHMVDYAGFPIGAHKVNTLWDAASLTWNNQPNIDPTAESIINIPLPANKQKEWHKWLIRELVQGWIDHTIINYGVVLKMKDENKDLAYKGFRSSDESEYSNEWPVLEILYTTP